MKINVETWNKNEHWLKFEPENKLEELVLERIYYRDFDKGSGRALDGHILGLRLDHLEGEEVSGNQSNQLEEILTFARALDLEEEKELDLFSKC